MHLTPEEKAIGKENFERVASYITRRRFVGGVGAAVVSGAGLGAMYFGYESSIGDRVRVGIIGTGDEGSVLIGSLTPSFIDVVAVADIRPYNIYRAFHGDTKDDNVFKVRPGLMKKYDWKTEDEARKHVKVYEHDYRELLRNKDVEAVIIALPLHLHAQVAIEAMRAGKHVLTEKLMGHTVRECKEMALVAKEQNKILAVGHQRHYSVLYDNAVDTIRRGLIGKVHSIRAQWHRDNQPGRDSWKPPLPDELPEAIAKAKQDLAEAKDSSDQKRLQNLVFILEKQYEDRRVKAEDHGYQSKSSINGVYTYSPMEELIRWRLWDRTGGGLMAELGSHQLDAAGIFISGLRKDHKKALPLTVSAAGTRSMFGKESDRECEDHVYCTYEFPGGDFENDPTDIVGVTYSSINGNGFGGYGEVVMGTKGTLVLEREQEVMIFPSEGPTTKVGVKEKGKDKSPVLDTTATAPSDSVGKAAVEKGSASRGYTEEMEHWAWCIRNPAPENKPLCHPEVALGDAVIALTTNIAMREKRLIKFDPDWFSIDSPATPENKQPDVTRYAGI